MWLNLLCELIASGGTITKLNQKKEKKNTDSWVLNKFS
jgi:hypothetical protein